MITRIWPAKENMTARSCASSRWLPRKFAQTSYQASSHPLSNFRVAQQGRNYHTASLNPHNGNVVAALDARNDILPLCRSRRPVYFTLAAPPPTFCLGALGVFGATGRSLATAGPPDGCFRLSRKLCQKIRIGLAMKTDEYVPTIMPTPGRRQIRSEPGRQTGTAPGQSAA